MKVHGVLPSTKSEVFILLVMIFFKSGNQDGTSTRYRKTLFRDCSVKDESPIADLLMKILAL